MFSKGPLPKDKIWALTKLKEFVDDKFNVAKMQISLFDRVENVVEKEKMVTSIFSFSHNVFKRLLSLVCYKSALCGKEFSLPRNPDF